MKATRTAREAIAQCQLSDAVREIERLRLEIAFHEMLTEAFKDANLLEFDDFVRKYGFSQQHLKTKGEI